MHKYQKYFIGLILSCLTSASIATASDLCYQARDIGYLIGKIDKKDVKSMTPLYRETFAELSDFLYDLLTLKNEQDARGKLFDLAYCSGLPSELAHKLANIDPTRVAIMNTRSHDTFQHDTKISNTVVASLTGIPIPDMTAADRSSGKLNTGMALFLLEGTSISVFFIAYATPTLDLAAVSAAAATYSSWGTPYVFAGLIGFSVGSLINLVDGYTGAHLHNALQASAGQWLYQLNEGPSAESQMRDNAESLAAQYMRVALANKFKGKP